MYTAIVLSEESRLDLLKVFEAEIQALGKDFQLQTTNGDPLIHHVTLNMGGLDVVMNDKSLLGKEITMEVVSFASDYRVAAFGIKIDASGYGGSKFGKPSVYSTNQIPHITIAINPKEGGKPFHSNDLQEWKPTHTVVEVRGILQEV